MLKVTLGAGLAQWVRRPPHAAWQESRKGHGTTRSKGLQIEVRPTPLYPVYLHLLSNKGKSQKIIRKKGGPYPFARLSTLSRYLIRVSITDSSKKAGKSLISCGERERGTEEKHKSRWRKRMQIRKTVLDSMDPPSLSFLANIGTVNPPRNLRGCKQTLSSVSNLCFCWETLSPHNKFMLG